MVRTVTIMNLLHYPYGFLRTEASQIWVRVQFEIRFLVHEDSEEYVSGSEMLQLLSFSLIVGECLNFEIGYNRIPPPQRSI